MLQVTIESKLPQELFQVLACVGFWNTEGFRIYNENKKGTLGNEITQAFARKVPLESFILDCLHKDIHVFANSKTGNYWLKGFKHGKGGSHIFDKLREELINLKNIAQCNNDYDCDRNLQSACESAESLLQSIEQQQNT